MKYRKKPVVVEAMLWDGGIASTFDICEWSNNTVGRVCRTDQTFLEIDTLEGVMTADIGDYIIKGVQGEFYPCKPDIFEATYEPAEDA